MLAGLYASAGLPRKEFGENIFNYMKRCFQKTLSFCWLAWLALEAQWHFISSPGHRAFLWHHQPAKKDVLYSFQFPVFRTPSPFSLWFPITFVWLNLFFTLRLLSVAKRWQILVSRVVSSFEPVHNGCVISFPMRRTVLGLLAFFNRVSAGFFWYLLRVTGIEQNQASGQASPE